MEYPVAWPVPAVRHAVALEAAPARAAGACVSRSASGLAVPAQPLARRPGRGLRAARGTAQGGGEVNGERAPRALTIRQPWAWAVIYAGKDVENRSWETSYRGTLIIHAGKGTDRDGIAFLRSRGISVPPEALAGGAVLGTVQLTGCVTGSPSPWAEAGEFHWTLVNPVPLAVPIPAKGKLGLWKPDAAVLAGGGTVARDVLAVP